MVSARPNTAGKDALRGDVEGGAEATLVAQARVHLIAKTEV